MIKEILLENFKAFGCEQRIPIKPITLIYGANSSGKSTILNAILLQKQTYEESSDPKTPLLFKGSYTDQQNYSRCINGRDVNKKLKMGIGYDPFYYDREHKITFVTYFASSTSEKEFRFFTKHLWNENNRTIVLNQGEKLLIGHNYRYERNILILESIEYKICDVEVCKLVRVDSNKLLYEDDDLSAGVPTEYLDKIPDEYRCDYNVPTSLCYTIDFDVNAPKLGKDSEFFKFDLTVISDDFVQELHNRLIIALKNDNPDYQEDSDFTSMSCSLFKSKLLEYMDNIVFVVKNGLPIYYTSIKDETNKAIYENGERKVVSDGFGSEFRKHKDIYSFIADYIIEATAQYLETMGEIVYLGPLRKRPERFTEIVKDTYSSVGNDGEYTTARIYDNPYALDSINSWLLKLGMNYEIRVHETTGDDQIAFGDIHSLQIIEKSSNIPLTLCDVGFGISQILPILVQSLMSGSKTILIEQPEIHLHPKMQAELGDFFISLAKPSSQKQCLAKPSSQKQFIIETHSEHLLLRIMRRIRETTTGKLEDKSLALTPDDVSVLYVESVDGESIVREMPLNEYGELVVPWPGGFFEEGLREMF